MKPKVKWYNDPQMVGTLLIFWPPVGIFGVYKSETIKPICKRITYAALSLGCLALILSFII